MIDVVQNTFSSKWSQIKTRAEGADERSLFVDIGYFPKTQRQVIFWNEFLFFRDILKRAHTRRVLEVGCGRGTMSLYLKKYEGLDVSLLDNAPDAIEVAKGELGRHNSKAEFYIADAVKTGLPSGSFDAVISLGLAEHLANVDELYKEAHRLLKNGGVMVSLNIPKKVSVQILNTWFRFVLKMLGKYKGDIRKDYWRNGLNPEDYKKVAECAGFQNVSYTHACPLPIFTPLSTRGDRVVAAMFKVVMALRGLLMRNPYVTNRFLAQEHFLVA